MRGAAVGPAGLEHRIQHLVNDYVRQESAEGTRPTVSPGRGAAGIDPFSYPAPSEDTMVDYAMIQQALVNLDDETLVLELDRRPGAAKTRHNSSGGYGFGKHREQEHG